MSDMTTLDTPVKPTLSDERKRELRDWWESIRAGRVNPAPLEVPQPVKDEVQAALAEAKAVGDDKSRRFQERSGTLSYLFGGRSILTLDGPGGCAILAAGDEEVALFYASSPPGLIERVRNESPVPWEDDECLFG
ncbi:MAG: hypothetical protein K2W96_23805 [Gemmataceae bacterium]|nr:hypothetical protein [Gemmataceae bacterium]